jgi:hypothetical protein
LFDRFSFKASDCIYPARLAHQLIPILTLMTTPTEFQRPLSDGLALIPVSEQPAGMTDELMFLQDAAGNYLSFVWQRASDYGLEPERLLGSRPDAIFSPVELAPYLERLQRVLSCRVAEHFCCSFRCGEQKLVLDLVMSPVLMPSQAPTTVIVAGRSLRSPDGTALTPALAASLVSDDGYPLASLSSDRYQRLLTQIAWNVRRTLDLPTIWQQTVQGLGRALSVSRCLVGPYERLNPQIKVIAEYCQESVPSMLAMEFGVADHPLLAASIASLKPIALKGNACSTDRCYRLAATIDTGCGNVLSRSTQWADCAAPVRLRPLVDRSRTGVNAGSGRPSWYGDRPCVSLFCE